MVEKRDGGLVGCWLEVVSVLRMGKEEIISEPRKVEVVQLAPCTMQEKYMHRNTNTQTRFIRWCQISSSRSGA